METLPEPPEEKESTEEEKDEEEGPEYPYQVDEPDFLPALLRELKKDMGLAFALEKGDEPVLEGGVLQFFPGSSFSQERIQSGTPIIRDACEKLTGVVLEVKIFPPKVQPVVDMNDPWEKQVHMIKNIFRGEVL